MNEMSRAVHKVLMVANGYVIFHTMYGMEYPDEMAKLRAASKYSFIMFITNWNLVVQLVFFVLSTLSDLNRPFYSERKKKSWIVSLVDFIFASVAFPAAVFVCGAFWGLYAIDRELIFPIKYDSFFPSWLNHGMHTLPVVAVVFELLIIRHKFPRLRYANAAATVFAGAYFALTLHIAATTGHWAYPVMRLMSNPGRFAFIGFCYLLLLLCLRLGYFLHSFRWGSTAAIDQSASEKKKKNKSKRR